MRTRNSTAVAILACALYLSAWASASPAFADLPPLACETGYGGAALVYCMSYENNYVTVSVGNRTGAEYNRFQPFKLELAYYRNTGAGAEIWDRTGLISNFWPNPYGVARTTPRWTIAAGYYCVRSYVPETGYWTDNFCYSDRGQRWSGKVGFGEKWK